MADGGVVCGKSEPGCQHVDEDFTCIPVLVPLNTFW
jgi:hypothetical protein